MNLNSLYKRTEGVIAKGVIVKLGCSHPSLSAGEFRSLCCRRCSKPVLIVYGFRNPDRFSMTPFPTGVCEKNTPPPKKTFGKTSFQSTKSGSGEQFLLLDSRAWACAKGVCLFTDTGITAMLFIQLHNLYVYINIIMYVYMYIYIYIYNNIYIYILLHVYSCMYLIIIITTDPKHIIHKTSFVRRHRF